MNAHRNPLRRRNAVRSIYRGTGGRTPCYGRVRASDLPTIAAALGITVTALLDTAKRLQSVEAARRRR